MKRPYEDKTSKKSVKKTRPDPLNDRLEHFDSLINEKNWQAATQVLNEEPEILARFRAAPASISLRPQDHLLPTLRYLLKNHASLELLGKFWIGNTKLHFALKLLEREDFQLMLKLVLALSSKHNHFKCSYIANIDDAELLDSLRDQPSTEISLAILKRVGELAPQPQAPAEAISQAMLQTDIADFTEALKSGQSKEVLSKWEKSPVLQKLYKGETIFFGSDSIHIPMSTLLGVVEALFTVPGLEPIINRIYSSCFDFEKYIKGEVLEKPNADDLLKLFSLMLDYTSTIFRPQDLLENPLLQETIKNLNNDCCGLFLNKILTNCQIKTLEPYVELINNVQLLEL